MIKHDISTVVQRFLPQLALQGSLSAHQMSMLKLMSLCKTAALGGHRERCDRCSHTKIHYNSCGNRNCPNCQGVNKEKWIVDRQHDLLPVKYFHCVFTVPSELYIYFRYNKKLLYGLLMRTVKDTLLTFGYDPKQGINGKIGGINVLHTWTQQLTYHPHACPEHSRRVHCIVPAGGLTKSGQWKEAKSKGNFLFPVRAMSRLFRGKLLAGIHELFMSKQVKLPADGLAKHKAIKNKLYTKEWNVYAKKAFGGPKQVLEYLGRYTHKICISNYRILKVTQTHVTFKYLDRKAKKSKIKTISGIQFLAFFAEHILPKGFVKIRHFGFLSARSKAKDLALIRKSLGAPTPPPKQKLTTREFMIITTGKDPYRCPSCEIGEMVIISIIPPIRGSPVKIPRRYFAKDRKIKFS